MKHFWIKRLPSSINNLLPNPKFQCFSPPSTCPLSFAFRKHFDCVCFFVVIVTRFHLSAELTSDKTHQDRPRINTHTKKIVVCTIVPPLIWLIGNFFRKLQCTVSTYRSYRAVHSICYDRVRVSFSLKLPRFRLLKKKEKRCLKVSCANGKGHPAEEEDSNGHIRPTVSEPKDEIFFFSNLSQQVM